MPDFSKLSDEALKALHAGDYSKLTDDELRALQEDATPDRPPVGGSVPGEFLAGAATGVARGAEHFPGAAASLLGMAGRAAESAGLGDPEKASAREEFGKANPPKFLTDALPRPASMAGKYGEAMGEFVPATLAGGGGWLSQLVGIIGGGAGAETARSLTDASDESYSNIAATVGGLVGGITPTALVRAVNPLPATARHVAHVGALEREGVTRLTAGQRAGSRGLRYMEEHYGQSPLAGQAAPERFREPFQQYTRAVLQRVGETADEATPAVIDRAHTRIGAEFDRLAARNDAVVDQNYIRDILQAQTEYDHLFFDPLRRPMVESVVQHARNMNASGVIEGPQYQAVRSRLERMRRGSKDPELNGFLLSVRDAMDDLMDRNLQRSNPADLGRWREVRNQYRNMLVLDMATTGAETGGMVTPAKLRQGAVSQQGRRNYARGRGDFSELGRAGENVMPGLPQSGTAPRALTQSGLLKLLTTGAAGRTIMSDPIQAWLANQKFTGMLGRLPGAGTAAGRAGVAELPMEEAPPRAAGGPASTGQPYMVGERGPELFVPDQSGTVVPNVQTAAMWEPPKTQIGRTLIPEGAGVSAGGGVSRSANQNINQAISPPLDLMERTWRNYASRMTPEEFLTSEALWGGAARLAEGTGMKFPEAFASMANNMFQRMGANRYMTPAMARAEIAKQRGIEGVPK